MATAADYARYLKAALDLADMTAARLAAEVASDLDIGLRTIERIMQGKRAPRRWEIARFAAALNVPEWFLYEGLEGPTAESREAGGHGEREREDRDELARRHDELLARLDDQAEMLRAIMASLDGARSPNG